MRRQCRRFEFQRILLPVRMRIHCGMGRFWAIFLASVRFVRKVLWDGCEGARRVRRRGPRGAWGSLGTRARVGVCAAFNRRRLVASAPPGGVGRSAVWADATGGAFGVGRSAGPPRPVAARARAVNSSNNSCVCCGQAPGSCVEARRAGGRAAAAAKARS